MAVMDSFSIRIFGPPGGEVRTTTPLCYVKILSTTPSCQHPLNPLKRCPYSGRMEAAYEELYVAPMCPKVWAML